MERHEIENRYSYHPPKGDQAERYEKIREKVKELAILIDELTPFSREQSLAYTHLDGVMMFANASISRNE